MTKSIAKILQIYKAMVVVAMVAVTVTVVVEVTVEEAVDQLHLTNLINSH